jgi:hypothetical protein
MATNKLYDIVKAVGIDQIPLEKAATDFTIDGTLTPQQALNLWDTVVPKSNILSRIRRVLANSNAGDLNQYVNEGILTGRAGAVTAMTAVRGGGDIANINKDNIGNSYTLKELYFLYDLLNTEMTNFAALGRNKFNTEAGNQIATGYANAMTEKFVTGDNGINEPYGIVPQIVANLAASPAEEATGKKVRNIDTAALTTITDRLSAVYKKQQIKYRKKCVILLSDADYETYKEEVDESSNYNGAKTITQDKDYKYKGIELIAMEDMTDNTYIMSPLDNMCYIMSIATGANERGTDVQKVPKTLVYWNLANMQFAFVTYDKVVYGYDQT